MRHSSITTAPASASFRMPIICSSKNCFRFICPSREGPVSRSKWMKKAGPVTSRAMGSCYHQCIDLLDSSTGQFCHSGCKDLETDNEARCWR